MIIGLIWSKKKNRSLSKRSKKRARKSFTSTKSVYPQGYNFGIIKKILQSLQTPLRRVAQSRSTYFNHHHSIRIKKKKINSNGYQYYVRSSSYINFLVRTWREPQHSLQNIGGDTSIRNQSYTYSIMYNQVYKHLCQFLDSFSRDKPRRTA